MKNTLVSVVKNDLCTRSFLQTTTNILICSIGNRMRFLFQTIVRYDFSYSSESICQSTTPIIPNEIVYLGGCDAEWNVNTFRRVLVMRSSAYTIFFENDV
jgi:hypothetical protein